MDEEKVSEAGSTVLVDLRKEDGRVVLTLSGRLNAANTRALFEELQEKLTALNPTELDIDVSRLEITESVGMSLLYYVSAGGITPRARISLHGMRLEQEQVFRSFSMEDYRAFLGQEIAPPSVAEEVGQAVVRIFRDFINTTAFVGAVTLALGTTLFDRRQMRWDEVWRTFETAGVNALPIVSLISVLVGLVIAFEAAPPLEGFGAQLYVVNMVGLVMVRELGPVMTAVILAGRSGSAFAAELGSMKVDEELDALATMGLDPVRFLVVQRVVASVLLTPLLTAYSMLTGVLGGVPVMRSLGFSFPLIWQQLQAAVRVGDIVEGLLKGVVFGILIAAISCLRGLQTGEGPRAVGVSTTRSVVSAIVLIIIADSVIAALAYWLKG